VLHVQAERDLEMLMCTRLAMNFKDASGTPFSKFDAIPPEAVENML
jgi:hypothetical protein